MDLLPKRPAGAKRQLRAPARELAVLDTSAFSILFRGDDKNSDILRRIQGQRAVISFQTVEEVKFGAYRAGWGERRINDLNRFLREFEVIWPNPELVEVCARLRARQSGAGRQLSPADCWIAATALLLACPLIAQDADFVRVAGLKLIWARG